MDYIMRMKRPASWHNDNWREGTPLGNGLHGALMYGNTANERVMLTHTKLWREGKSFDIPDVSGVLPKMQKLIFERDVPNADSMISDALIEKGYAPHEAFPFPAADIHITLPPVVGFSKYTRSLNMSTAEAVVSYFDQNQVTRRGFVSRSDDVIVIECDKDCEITVKIHSSDLVNQRGLQLPQNSVTKIEGEWIYFKAEIGGEEHGVVARVIKNKTTLVIAKIYTDGTNEAQWKTLKNEIGQLPADYVELFKRHLPIHQKLFNSCEFVLEDDNASRAMSNEELLDIAYDEGLPNTLTERMWAYGRYLLISGTQVGGLPCNLTGLWSGEYRAFWAFNMANINLEMTYWQALSGGLAELMSPVFDYYDSGIEDFRENARKLYGCNGIFVPAVTMPTGTKHVCLSPHITNWTAGAGWIAQHYYDYYIYTRDEVFLKERALPFMREAAKFYLDFVVWQGSNWHVCPSISPENHTHNYKKFNKDTLDEVMQSSIDAAMDIAVIKELFTHLICISKNTDLINEQDAKAYQKMLDGAISYQTNEWNAPREWLHDDFPDNDYHRHQSHLYPMFPGLELARKDLKTSEIYHNGAKRRMTVGLSSQTSWSLIQNANTMARVKDGELAHESLNLISKACVMRNLFTTHNDWRGSGIGLSMASAPFQIDANTGWPSAIQEMLMFSDFDRVDIFPALPNQWRRGRIGPLQTRCGINVTIEWENNKGNASLKADRDTRFMLYLPMHNEQGIEKQLTANEVFCTDFCY